MFGGTSQSNKRDTQRLILISVASILCVYVLFSYIIPFVQHKIEREFHRRELLKRLEAENAKLNDENRDENQDSAIDQKSNDNHATANKISDKKNILRRYQSSSLAQEASQTSEQFLPQYSNIPAVMTIPVEEPADLRKRGLEESRQRLIEQQNKEYEESLAKERVIEEAANERKRHRQSIIDRVKPEPDERYSKDDVVIFAFRAKSLSVKAEELNKPFKKTRKFLKSHTWEDVINFIRSLELRPIDAPFIISANDSTNNFKVSFDPNDVSGHSIHLLHQELGASEVPSNTVLWVHFE